MKSFLPLLALSALAFLPTRAHASVDYVLAATGNLHCNDTSHTEPGFPVQSFTVGGSDPLKITSSATGSGGGKISLSDFSVNRKFDNCSENLVRGFLGQTVIPVLTFTAYRVGADGKSDAILIITLGNALISNYQISGSGDLPQESVSFTYEHVRIQSTQINKDGTLGPISTTGWNAVTNKVD